MVAYVALAYVHTLNHGHSKLLSVLVWIMGTLIFEWALLRSTPPRASLVGMS